MFTENSIVVRTWVKKIKDGTYTYDDVPNLSNLREMVERVLRKDEPSV